MSLFCQPSNTLWTLNLGTMAWSSASPSGSAAWPSARYEPDCAHFGNSLFVLNGDVPVDSGTALDPLSGLWQYNVSSFTWRSVVTTNTPHAAVFSSTTLALSRLVFHGGYVQDAHQNYLQFAGVSTLDLQSLSGTPAWSPVDVTGCVQPWAHPAGCPCLTCLFSCAALH